MTEMNNKEIVSNTSYLMKKGEYIVEYMKFLPVNMEHGL